MITEQNTAVRLFVQGTEIEINGTSPITIKINDSDISKIQQNVVKDLQPEPRGVYWSKAKQRYHVRLTKNLSGKIGTSTLKKSRVLIDKTFKHSKEALDARNKCLKKNGYSSKDIENFDLTNTKGRPRKYKILK